MTISPPVVANHGPELSPETQAALRFTARDRASIRFAANPNRLLLGENPLTERPEEISGWVATYTELAAFNDDMIARIASRLGRLEPVENQPEALDLPLARAHALRLRLRLYYWKARARRFGQRSTFVR